MLNTVYVEETKAYYDAALAYYQAVKDVGADSDEAAEAAADVLALAVEAHRAGATKGELDLLKSVAKVIVNNGQ